jgi:hypothetical protein
VVPIVDIFYTPLLVLTLVTCAVVRRVKRWDGRRASLAIGWAGFALSVGYLVAGHAMHERAVTVARRLVRDTHAAEAAGGASETGEDAAIRRAEAYPALGSILTWRTVVETADRWQVARVRPLAAEPVEAARVHTAGSASGTWVDRARGLPAARAYAWFAMGRIRAEYRRDGDEHVVTLHDMRYGPRPDDPASLWPLVVRFGPDGQVRGARRLAPRGRGDLGRFLSDAWADMWGR